jgi:hypothetical protein
MSTRLALPIAIKRHGGANGKAKQRMTQRDEISSA